MATCTCADPTMVAQAISKPLTTAVQAVADNNKEGFKNVDETMYGSAAGGEHGFPAPIRFCDWAAPEYGPIGENNWNNFFQAASFAIAVANSVAQNVISNMQMDLADKYYNMAKYKWDRFQNRYMPLEKQLLAEVSNVSVRSIDCAGAHSRAQNAVNTSYDNIDGYTARMAKAYRMCIDPALLGYADNRRNMMTVDTENYNLADERWFTDVKNDQRWNRRSNVLNLGRNLTSEALKYGDVANSLLKQVGGHIERGASSIIQSLGYYGARNDTYYPTTYLGSAGGMGTQVVQVGTPASVNPINLSPAGSPP